MTRMHSDGRGSSGSDNPTTKSSSDWIDYDGEEVVDLVVKLRRDGHQPAQIGLKLRDQYGIPSVKEETGMSITEILEQEGMELDIPEDLRNLVDKAENIQDHLEDNQEDEQARRRLELTEAKIRRVADYHRENGNIDEEWEYERDE